MIFRFPSSALLLALSPFALSAQNAPQCDAATRSANNGACPSAAPKSTAQKFPYPGDHPDAGTPTSTPQPGTAQKFPYPGDNPSQGDAPAPTQPAPTTQPASDSSGAPETPQFPGTLPRYQRNPDPPSNPSSEDPSSSSSSSSAAGDPNALDKPALKDEGSSAEDAVKPTHHTPKPVKPQPVETADDRVEKDLSVAEFYMRDQNYIAAYDRAKDATTIQPTDPYSHFALAEAARKLGKLDEAKAEYQQVLKLDPIPKQAKAAKAALAEMEGRN